jgi:membrane-bound lytic murein transglycosylase A
MKRTAEASTQVSMRTGTSLLVLAACLGCWLASRQAQAAGAQAAPRSEGSGQRELSNNSSFSTKYAHFESARFADLPGWQLDDLGDAWAAFLQTCSVLGKREAWEGTCARARLIKAGDSAVVRGFFEDEFTLFQIQNKNRTPAGVITGYYEPLLAGSRRRAAPYTVPVYARPDDMLYLDARLLTPEAGNIMVSVSGKQVVPANGTSTPGAQGYTLDLGQLKPDIRTKRYRLRVNGDRIVPYYSRGEIERSSLPRAKVIAWVSSAADFYSMQIQGSGKVRLPNGSMVRLAYAEQNGHPFLPSLRALPAEAGGSGDEHAVVTRGLRLLERPEMNAPTGEDKGGEAAGDEPRTRGIVRRAATPGRDNSAEVERMIAALMTPRTAPDRPAVSAPVARRPLATATGLSPPAAPRAQQAAQVNTDPSYVFFREIPDSDTGPIGAMGIPLTAGRSIAVDPRTSPLGFPVFVSTTRPDRRGKLNRLMLAQDTGGAIRGAVRADFFWGFGASALSQAIRMNEAGKMWLLLPKQQELPGRAVNATLRGRGVAPGGQDGAECVVPDPELCVE